MDTVFSLAAFALASLGLGLLWLYQSMKHRLTIALQREKRLREEAEAASEAKSRFVATVSHELRTPLNGILGMAELLFGTDLTAEQMTYAEAIRTSGTGLVSLVDEILDFSKIEAGELALQDETFDLAALVEEVTELLAPRAQSKGLGIASFIAANVAARVQGDAGRLRQILLNLLGNAVKFTPEGGVGLKVSLGSDHSLQFDIQDTGQGIAPEQQSQIFESYRQAVSANRHEGTGLGLAISRRIANEMGGSLTLEDSTERGSVFRLKLPLNATSAAIQNPGDEILGLEARHALIVASKPFEGLFLREKLEEAGLRTRQMDGLAAFALLTSSLPPGDADGSIPDIILVDCAIGIDLTEKLGAAARAAGVARSLLLFSPFERRSVSQSTIQAFDGWLVKPIRARSLLARLQIETTRAPKPAAAHTISAPVVSPFLLRQADFEVLLAEDDDINALLVTRHLERLGGQVTRCRDGASAVSLAIAAAAGERPSFHLIFLDIRMPGQSGLQAASDIREAENRLRQRRAPMIALTADLFELRSGRIQNADFDEILAKPADFRQISRIVETVITASQRPHTQSQTGIDSSPAS
jgi:CheY-like chemotaxis protein/nitrogen-specific signal transduction histidine kinase